MLCRIPVHTRAVTSSAHKKEKGTQEDKNTSRQDSPALRQRNEGSGKDPDSSGGDEKPGRPCLSLTFLQKI